MKLISDNIIEVPKLFYCRMSLPEKILDQAQVKFEMESKWSREIGNYGWYETGFEFTEVSGADREVLDFLLQKWMMEESQKINRSDVTEKREKELPRIRVLKS
jgi:hypothetical protein